MKVQKKRRKDLEELLVKLIEIIYVLLKFAKNHMGTINPLYVGDNRVLI